MQEDLKNEETIRQFVAKLALEGLADSEAKGIAVTPELIRQCITTALKEYLDSEQAQAQLATVVDLTYAMWQHDAAAKAN
jgi:hypothetical protein